MLVARFKVQCKPEKTEQALATVGLLGELLAVPPEATLFHVSSSEPWEG